MRPVVMMLHTLAFNPNDSQITSVDARDGWLIEHAMNCNDAEMNGDGVIDETDLLLFSTEYAASSRRADMDRSGVIDVLDYNIYMDEYAKRP